MKRIFGLAAALCLLVSLGAPVVLADAPAQSGEVVRVGVFVDEPFVIHTGARYEGYAIEYWQALADELGFAFDYVLFPSEEAATAALQNNAVDVMLGAVDMTPELEEVFDLTHAYYTGGLQILTRPPHQQSFGNLFAPLIEAAVLRVLAVALLFAVVMAHVIYFIERHTNSHFQQGYLRGIWEAFWYLLSIVATGEYGDKEARAPIKRIVTVSFWLLGVVFIAQFTATATSNMTIQQLSGEIQGPGDLPGKRVVAAAESDAADFLTDREIQFQTVPDIKDAYALLESDQADAVVGDAPILQYYANHAGRGKVVLAGEPFGEAPIGIALANGSAMRERLNVAILKFYDNGVYTELAGHWFGEDRQ